MIDSPRSRRPTLEEVAYHEAGHVAAGDRLGLTLVEVDIERDAEGGRGHTVFRAPEWYGESSADPRSRAFVAALVTTFLAGTAAEARLAGFANPESSGFDEDAVIRRWAARLGPPAEVEARLATLRAEAARIVAEPATWAAIARLAGVLLRRRRLPAAAALAALGAGRRDPAPS